MNPHIPEALKTVRCVEPQPVSGLTTGDYVSLKNVDMAYIVAHLAQNNAAVQELIPLQASAVAGTGAKALTNDVPIWSNLDCAASDLMVKRTAAKTYSSDAGQKDKIIVFQIDPAGLDIANGFDCIGLQVEASATFNILDVLYVLKMRYAEDQAPAVITD